MTIWKKPSANIDSDSYVDYDLKEDTLDSIWPKVLDLSTFHRHMATGTLQRNIGVFYRQLGNELFNLEMDMSRPVEAFEDAYMTLNNTIKDILESLKVNENFLL